MKVDESFERALSSPQPMNSLRSLAREMFSRGQDKAAVVILFEAARQALREAGREEDEDAVMDVMDFLVGWCSPHMKLGPTSAAEPTANGSSAHSRNGSAAQRCQERGNCMKYKVAIHRTPEGISVAVLALPGCWAEGDTEEEVLANMRDAIREHLAALEDRHPGAEIRDVEV